jgi:hypothetical protein
MNHDEFKNRMEEMKSKAARAMWMQQVTELVVDKNMHPLEAMRCLVVIDMEGQETFVSPPLPEEIPFDEAIRQIGDQLVEAGRMSLIIGYHFDESAFFYGEICFPKAPSTVSEVDIEQMVGMIPDSPDEINWGGPS